MRPRKWVLVTSFLFLIIIVALYLEKRHLEKNRDLETLLVQSISPIIKGTIDVSKVRIGFFSAHLYGISLSIPLESFSVNVDHIKIGFSFLKLFNSKGDYSKAINKIIFISPDIIFTITVFKLTGINPDSIGLVVPVAFENAIGGDGWIDGRAWRSKPEMPYKTQFHGEGFDLGKLQNIRFNGACSITNDLLLVIDSLLVSDGNVSFTTSGTVEVDSLPIYDLTNLRSKSIWFC